MTVEIRPGSEADVDQISQVLVDTWRSTFRGRLSDEFLDGMTYENQAERHRRTIRRPEVAYWVACSADGQVVGFVNGGPIRRPLADCEAELYALYLRPSFQGQGVGARLVTVLARRLAEQSLRSMLVWVLATNPNIGFYERMGARALTRMSIRLGPDEVEEIAYVWDDLGARFA